MLETSSLQEHKMSIVDVPATRTRSGITPREDTTRLWAESGIRTKYIRETIFREHSSS